MSKEYTVYVEFHIDINATDAQDAISKIIKRVRCNGHVINHLKMNALGPQMEDGDYEYADIKDMSDDE